MKTLKGPDALHVYDNKFTKGTVLDCGTSGGAEYARDFRDTVVLRAREAGLSVSSAEMDDLKKKKKIRGEHRAYEENDLQSN